MSRPRSWFHTVTLLAAFTLVAVGRAAAVDSKWAVSLRSTYPGADDAAWFSFPNHGSIAASRPFRTHLALLVSTGYASSSGPLRIYSIPEVGLKAGLDASLVPVAVGLRISPVVRPGESPQPFLEIAPALYWYRYRARVESSYWYGQPTRVSTDALDRVVPGLVAGAVVPMRLFRGVGLEVGLSYYLTGTLSTDHRLIDAGRAYRDYLHTLRLMFGLSLRP